MSGELLHKGDALRELREALAAAVPDWAGLCDDEPQRLADALLPEVLRYGRDKAAEELRAVARSLPPTEDRTANRIHDRADALTTDPA